MDNITATKFYNLFMENCKEDGIFCDKTLMSLYRHNAEYTEIVNKTIIHNIIKDLELTPQFEYFRIDVIGWESHYDEICEEAKALDMNPHLWDLKIAVEHENDKKDWYDEVIKLVHVRCPLKVIIGYNYCNKRDDNEEGDVAKLKFAAECMKKTNAFNNSAEEEYLVILGNCKAKGEGTYDSFDYRGYLYNYSTGQFIKLQ